METPTKQLLLELPEDVHLALKMRATAKKTNMRAFVGKLIEKELEKEGKTN